MTQEMTKETMRAAVIKFLAADGHDLCHENRRELAEAFGLPSGQWPCLPPEKEFRERCDRYRQELYGADGPADPSETPFGLYVEVAVIQGGRRVRIRSPLVGFKPGETSIVDVCDVVAEVAKQTFSLGTWDPSRRLCSACAVWPIDSDQSYCSMCGGPKRKDDVPFVFGALCSARESLWLDDVAFGGILSETPEGL